MLHVLGEVDLAHPADAELVEDQITAELEPLVFASGKSVGMKARDQPGIHEPVEHLGRGRRARVAAPLRPTRNASR